MKKVINKEFKKIKKLFINLYKDFKKNPKKTTLTILNAIIEIIKNNILFFVYVVVNVFIGILLRYFTINTIDNLFLLKPILADLAIVLLVGAFSFAFRRKYRYTYLLTASIVFTIICIANSIYYTFYTSFISVSLIATSRYAVQVGDAIIENVLQVKDFVYILSPLLLSIIYFRLKKIKPLTKIQKERRDPKKMISVLTGAGVVLFLFIISLTPLEIGRYAKQWNREYIVMRFGVYAYQVNDIVKSIEPQLTSLFGYDQAVKVFNEYYSEKEDKQPWKNKYTGIFKGKNVLVIHYESMQTSNIGLKFNGVEVTPTLNKLAKDSIYFSNYYPQVSVGTSSDTEFTFNTSLMPTNTGTAFVSYFDREYVAIPSLLKEKGYYTFSMHANNGSFWNRNIMHHTLGYERFYSKNDYEIDEWIGLGLSDRSFYKQSIEKIKEINAKGQPYYGTIITLTNHTPFSDTDLYGEFDVSLKVEEVNPETGKKELVTYPYMEGTKLGNYFKSAHYADVQLGVFIDALESEGILDNTVLVIYGDHDARLSRSDYNRLYNYDYTTDSVRECDEELDETCNIIDSNEYELLRKVPLLIYSKETKQKYHKEVTTVMGMYDAMPTLGNMLGFYNKYQLGHDIFNVKDDNIVIFPNGNWVTNKLYYNSQNGSMLALSDEIPANYIEECTEYAEKILNVSNSTIVFDLIKKDKEQQETDDYLEEVTVSN